MSGGYEKYLFRLLPRLARHPDVAAVQAIFLEQARGTRLWDLATSAGPKVSVSAVSRFYAPLSRSASGELRAAVVRFAPDVVFVPNLRLLFLAGYPQLLMVRNMEPLVWDHRRDPLRHRLVDAARRTEGRFAAKRAARLIAVSGFVRDFVVTRWGIPEDRVGVVYHGCDPVDAPARRPAAAPAAVGRFLFTAGATRPSRGLEDVIDAVRRADPRTGGSLFIAGRADPTFRRYEAELRSRTAGDPRIRWLGQLDEAEMAWCYGSCAVFVMTSRVEACPNIGLEALARGCAIVAADNPPLPEIFGTAAVYYHPGDSADLAERLDRIASAPGERARLAALATRRAADFSWDRTTDETVLQLHAAARTI